MTTIGTASIVGAGALGSVAALLLFAGCAESGGSPEQVGSVESAIGEPNAGFPSPLERLGIMAINRARSDPATVKGAQSAAYPAKAPVVWNYDLSRSSRFQAISLQLSGVGLQHESPCALKTDVGTSGCTGDPACACATPVPSTCTCNACTPLGTAPFTRIAFFTAGTGVNASGEVAAAGYSDPFAVVDGWMDEAAGSDGHRKILTDQGSSTNVMGYGHSKGAGCWSTFDFSDSGKLAGVKIPKIPTAAVRPASGAAGSYTFYATWADPALGAPSSLNVVIDGVCKAMDRELGSDTLNATYKTSSTLAAGCHSYYVIGVDSGSTSLNYPTTGALTISVGGTACSADYLNDAPAASCAPGGGGTGGTSGSTGGTSSGGSTSSAGGTSSGGSTSSAGMSGSNGAAGGGGKSGAGGMTSVGGSTGAGGVASGGVGGSLGAGGVPNGTAGSLGTGGVSSGTAGSGPVSGASGAQTSLGGAVSAGSSGVAGSSAASGKSGSTPASSPSGCSCSTPKNSKSNGALWGLALFAVLVARARRRNDAA